MTDRLFAADLGAMLGQIDATFGQPLVPPDGKSGTYRDIEAFRNRIGEWMARVRQEYAPQVQKRIVLEMFSGVVRVTPVGNKAIWRSNLGKPADRHTPRGYVGGQARRSWRITVGPPGSSATGQDPITVLAQAKITDRINVANPLPYMERLNNGWSSQAPAGWVERVMADVDAKYRRIP